MKTESTILEIVKGILPIISSHKFLLLERLEYLRGKTMGQGVTADYLLKECEFIQDVISRMASNQFYIKGWTVTLVVASLLLKGNIYHYLVAFIPLVIFWFYDSYFLRLEKLYRAHYTWLVDHKSEENAFCLDIDKTRIESRLKKQLENKFIESVPCIPQLMFSKTVFGFYSFILLIVLLAIGLEVLL